MFNNRLVTDQTKATASGAVSGSCTYIADDRCQGIWRFQLGEEDSISVNFRFVQGVTDFASTILGGTGKYAGKRGTVSSTFLTGDLIQWDFTFQ